ncbi:MAG: oligosaccharide flippase family protein [Flavobacteriales bacterium]
MKDKFLGIVNHPLARNFFVYSFGALFLKGVSFLLLPLYTKLLSPAEYGILDLLSTFANVLDITLSLGLLSVIIIEYYHHDDEGRKKMFHSIISIFISISTLLYLIALAIAIVNKEAIFPEVNTSLIIFVTATSYLTFFQSFIVLILKQQERATTATLLQVGAGIISVILNVLFVYGMSLGVQGIIWSSFIGVLLFSIYSWYFIFKEIEFKFNLNKEVLKNYLALGLPFIPNAITLWLMTSANRWILLKYSDLDSVGYFSLAFKFSSLFDPLIIQPFLGAYTPRILNRFKTGDYRQPISSIVIAGIPGFLIAGFVLQYVAQLMIDPKFSPSLILIPILVFSSYFSLMAQVSAYILVFRKKVIPMVVAISAASILGVLANFILVPKYGGLGSAIAANIGGLIWFAAIYYLQRKERILLANGH